MFHNRSSSTDPNHAVPTNDNAMSTPSDSLDNINRSTTKSTTTTTTTTTSPLHRGETNKNNNNNNNNENLSSALDASVLSAVAQCDWQNRILWTSRQLLGGQSVNGFLRATAAVQRIKRQRARQANVTRAKQEQRQQHQQQQSTTGKQPPTIESNDNNLPDSDATNNNNNNNADATNNNNNKKRDAQQINNNPSSSSSQPLAPPTTTTPSNLEQQQQDEEEEEVKVRIMNPRTAKKIKSEMDVGLKFCDALHHVVRELLLELAIPGTPIPPPLLQQQQQQQQQPSATTTTAPGLVVPRKPSATLSSSLPNLSNNPAIPSAAAAGAARISSSAAAFSPILPTSNNNHNSNNSASKILPNPSLPTPQPNKRSHNLPMPPAAPTTKHSSDPSVSPPPKTNNSPLPPQSSSLSSSSSMGKNNAKSALSATTTQNAKTSTLRKNRKKKIPPSTEPLLKSLPPEVLEAIGGKQPSPPARLKKELSQKSSQVLHYRALRQGDPVAAKVSSRELWILARVLKDSGPVPSFAEILLWPAFKRTQWFKSKSTESVAVVDVEDDRVDHRGTLYTVPRNLVLPLPRNYSEAADWCAVLYRKGSRVLAMYPDTTALYCATVVDSTTYCQELDDIVVVQFDEDEPDEKTGTVPKCHIPSRFVAPMPWELLSKTTPRRTGTRRSTADVASQPLTDNNNAKDTMDPSEDGEDLDFDLGLGTG